jgi:hypothetical protein
VTALLPHSEYKPDYKHVDQGILHVAYLLVTQGEMGLEDRAVHAN